MEHSLELELELEPEQHLKDLVKQLELVDAADLPKKFKDHFQHTQKCSVENFAIYYLAALRQQTEHHFRNGPSNESDTPQNQTPVRQPKCHSATRDQELNESQLSQLSLGNESTPVRQTSSHQLHGRHSFSGTPPSCERASNRSAGVANTVPANSFCLGDFILNSTPNHGQQRAKKKLMPQESANNKAQKPRRRVVPMTISKNISGSNPSISFGDTSSFSNENNLLRLSQGSELDYSQGVEVELEARKVLLLRRQQIKDEAPIDQEHEREREREREREQALLEPELIPISFELLSDAKQIEVLAGIYSLLMDLNLVPNVLSEISYTIQLLNIRAEVAEGDAASSKSNTPLSHLAGFRECIYFAVKLLELQSDLLLQFDRKSLAVLLQHERISLLAKEIVENLELASQRKQLQSKQEDTLPDIQSEQQNVYYQHEKDSRENFPSQHEFEAFKTQRDLFYKALKQWEQVHLNRAFCFSRDLGQIVREIFKHSEHAVNMAHFAKLFVSQLLMSSGETHESPEELGLKLDQQRLNRLAQRLVTSNSSVEDQFPRRQAFFRDFISECKSIAFLAQLQLALYIQLLRHNDSSFELMPLQSDGEEDQEQVCDEVGAITVAPFIVRSHALAELLMLAKFLGYVYAFPYNRSSSDVSACPQQLQLRRQFQPPFEIHPYLERAMRQGKLLITLPWLVQYLVMLDLITLQLPSTLATLELLYTLYGRVVAKKSLKSLQPCAVFIIRTCIGWLLESRPILSDGYYSQRTRKPSEQTVTLVTDCLRNLDFLDKGKPASLLEQLLPVACPFLHEFCVSIAPSQRQVHRSGRFRYITTRLEQLSGSKLHEENKVEQNAETNQLHATSADNPQRKLVGAFLHSQNASMRRLLEFVTERSFKCVVKNAQHTILLPSKAAADALVNAISSTDQQEVQREIQRIYQQARAQAAQQWAEQVPIMLDERIELSLQALLPDNTHKVLHRTYAHLIKEQAQPKLHEWLQSSVLQSNFYHGDLSEMASKVCRANAHPVSNSASSTKGLCLMESGELSLSGLLHELQQWVHCLSLRPDYLCYLGSLNDLLERTEKAAQLKKLPSYFFELIGSLVVRMMQLIIYRQPQLFTKPIINSSCKVWLFAQQHGDDSAPAFLDTLLSVSYMQELSGNLARFPMLQHLLNAMLEAQVVSMDKLNELIMPLFKVNWEQPVWSALSQLLHQLSQNRDGYGDNNQSDDDGKSQLFMEMLGDLSQDLDSF